MSINEHRLNEHQLQSVIDTTHRYIDESNRRLDLKLPYIPVRFDLKGKASGMFVVRRGEKFIRYNEIIFSHYLEDSLLNTTAHEVAHYVVYELYGRRRVKPHGREWKQVMHMLGVRPEVTSRYDLSGLPLRQQQQFLYQCQCRLHQLTATRHNRVQAHRAIYHCRSCLKPLKFIEALRS